MQTELLTIPQKTLVDILKSQPESVIIDIFEQTLIEFDDSPLTIDEIEDIRVAKEEYYNGNTIEWKR